MTPGLGTKRRPSHAKRRGWITKSLVAVVALLALGALVAAMPLSAHTSTTRTSKSPAPAQAPAPASTTVPSTAQSATTPWVPAIGVYAGPGGLAQAQTFNQALGGNVDYALDFVDDGSWNSIADPYWTLANWSGTPFHMIFGIPMLPVDGSTLAAGAAGDYNLAFVSLATQLIAAGQGNAILMLGWDPMQSVTPWAVHSSTQASQYVAYWHQIVNSIRSVPGAHFSFEWDGGTPAPSVALESVYPGDNYVNLVATNVFDRLWSPSNGSRWAALLSNRYGPSWFAQFAQAHHKPLVIGEWGLVTASSSTGGGGDDAPFVHQLLSWCAANQVALAVTWDYGTWGIASGAFPAAQSALSEAGHDAGVPTRANGVLQGVTNGT